LAKLIQSLVPVQLEDLEPEMFANMLEQNTELALEPVIEIIDRCWQMGPFLQKAIDLFPDHKKLLRVSRAYHLWDVNLKSLFNQR
jgi:hypothetical protein